ncbi:TRAP dicarboxylate transporter- DctP subunit [Desulfitobacterium hafniense DCB-2]|uniref:TRAP dicarboxylate transporter-DctP subunit n=1 Tax=Desulfitobacterium hafniense (strain DSM 10664 / DCB-2) TaxID=272564 RepID=B8G183_DESHD|nr:TRAP transporter substrate-binding protein [Desulfitobacterium hafniense]ACL19298.1 TRAP dicarboxylate transporter- DctP subunit [Desulfitobacterium hafniense DCB-2]
MKRRFTGALVMLLSALLLLSGCGGGNAPAQTGESGGKAAVPEFTWKFQVVHNPEQMDYKMFKEVCDQVYEATNGRMKIELYPSGSFASSMEAFQACGEGVFEMHSSWPSYVKGVEYAFVPIADGNMSMGPLDRMIFLEQGGGKQLMQEAFDKLNLQFISYRIWPPDTLASRYDFKSIAEMKGKKFRTSAPDIAVAQGISAITLPIEEIFTAMASGAVDMLENCYLSYNHDLGITDIAPYGIYPDFWNCSFVETVVVNKNAWNKLPEDIKIIVKSVFDAKMIDVFAKAEITSAQDLKELDESGKVNFRRLDAEQFKAMRQDMMEIEAAETEKQGQDSLTAKTYETIYEFYRNYYPYKELTAHWSTGLTASEAAGFQIPKYHKDANE